MGGSSDNRPTHAHRCAPTHVEAVARVSALAAQLEREQFDEHATSGSPMDAYAVARELGYRRGFNDAQRRTLACLRELRSALVVETHSAPILFESTHVPGEWET